MSCFKLIPFGAGCECLKVVRIYDHEIIIVGKNAVTGIDSSSVYQQLISQSHIQFSNRNKRLYFRILAKDNAVVSVNDKLMNSVEEQEIAIGDKLSLLGNINYFNYKIDLELPIEIDDSVVDRIVPVISLEHELGSKNEKESCEIIHVEADTEVSNRNILSAEKSVVCKILDMSECGICFAPMAYAHSISPCGHSFCYTCLADWMIQSKTCPNCQGIIQSLLPSYIIDNVVGAAVKDDSNVLQDLMERREIAIKRKKDDNNNMISNNANNINKRRRYEAVMAANVHLNRISSLRTTFRQLTRNAGSRYIPRPASLHRSNPHFVPIPPSEGVAPAVRPSSSARRASLPPSPPSVEVMLLSSTTTTTAPNTPVNDDIFIDLTTSNAPTTSSPSINTHGSLTSPQRLLRVSVVSFAASTEKYCAGCSELIPQYQIGLKVTEGSRRKWLHLTCIGIFNRNQIGAGEQAISFDAISMKEERLTDHELVQLQRELDIST